MTDCDELAASIDEECSYDGAQIHEFTKKMKENRGDFTMSFWVKPTGANSLVKDFNGDPMFVPQVLLQAGKISCMHACTPMLSPAGSPTILHADIFLRQN